MRADYDLRIEVIPYILFSLDVKVSGHLNRIAQLLAAAGMLKLYLLLLRANKYLHSQFFIEENCKILLWNPQVRLNRLSILLCHFLFL